MNSWINTYTGRRFDYLNPAPDMIDLRDIAHALSRICRFTGHTSSFYSVARHSLYVASYVDRSYKLYALLHDAAEAYIGDINTILKTIINQYSSNALSAIETNIMNTIYDKFHVQQPDVEIIKQVKDADTIALYVEAVRFLNPNALEEWNVPVNKQRVREAMDVFDDSEYSMERVEDAYINAVEHELMLKVLNR